MGMFGNRLFYWMLPCLLFLGISLAPVPSLAGDEPEVYGGIEYFTWREFDEAGQILKESGPRYEIGFTNTHEFPNHMTLKPRVEFFGGDVDYNGQACDIFGNCVPASTDTYYFGLKGEMDLGGRLRVSESFILEPFGGLGIRGWSRKIKDSALAVGYTENWTTFYGRMGLRAEQNLSGRSKLFIEGGVKLPIRTSNYIDDSNVSYSSINLHPRNEPSFFAEVGAKLTVFSISAYYDSMRFKQSDVVYNYDPFSGLIIGYFQPKSESDMIGVRFGYLF
ncbi:MAG TPA: hypothetical protein VL197_13325 [Nitrospirota bacterium]|nr:hypothetical protein [Nitrospirota bacterium]